MSKHQYVDETELKSLIIRINNKDKDLSEIDLKKMNKYIQKHTKSKSQKHKRILREYIIMLSERNKIDKESYERFGEIILLIIKNILKKPKFSGYTYRDDFYSDATDKILRYLRNFNHKLISKISGQPVNSFAYISQIIHNSILFIINTKNAEQADVERYISQVNDGTAEVVNASTYTEITSLYVINIPKVRKTVYDDIINYKITDIKEKNIEVRIPEDYKISLMEYTNICKLNKDFKKLITLKRIKEQND